MPSIVSAELVVHNCIARCPKGFHLHICCHECLSCLFCMQGASGAELKACCTEAGMFALRERRVHVTQEDFEMAVAKVMAKDTDKNTSIKKLWK